MNQRQLYRINNPCYLGQTKGDLDKDPNHTDIWYSFETEEEGNSLDDQILAEIAEKGVLQHLHKDQQQPPKTQPLAIQKLKEYTPKDRISQVQNGSYVTNCVLKKTKFDLSLLNKEIVPEDIKQMLGRNYQKNKDGTIEMVNQEILKRQKQVLGSLVKQFGSALFSGKSIMGISLPVAIFEPQSQLEREAFSLLFAPHYLEQAGATLDKVEQFRLAVAFLIASLHIGTNPQKPFNPILGETFQGIIGDSPVYAEQISHHPPVCALQLLGKNYTLDAKTEFTASISLNSVRSAKVGYLTVTYKNTKSKIMMTYPAGLMSGTAFGRRTFQFIEKFYVFDIENRFYTEIDFDLDKNVAFKKACKGVKPTKDSFFGEIHKVSQKFANKLKEESAKSPIPEFGFREKDHSIEKFGTVEGSWMTDLKIAEQNYWSHGNPWPYKLRYLENPLPSDANFRLDVLYLRAQDEEKSQENKQKLEEIQRADRKLREQQVMKSKK